jgi:hypothetical protein
LFTAGPAAHIQPVIILIVAKLDEEHGIVVVLSRCVADKASKFAVDRRGSGL